MAEWYGGFVDGNHEKLRFVYIDVIGISENYTKRQPCARKFFHVDRD